MYKKFLLIVLFVFNINGVDNSLLAVVIMVKNEVTVIVDTLQPYVDGGVKYFLVFDTGSTDGTQDVTREFFKKHGITNGYVAESSFIDFASSRNQALDLTEEIFPEVTFMIMPDAEWYIRNVTGLLQFCVEHAFDHNSCYSIAIRSSTLEFYTARLIRTGRGVRFVGCVHEYVSGLAGENVPHTVYFDWRVTSKGYEKSAERWKRDRELLLKSHEEDPNNIRTVFYLAQVYECLGDYENAYKYYKKRADMQGWDEENFMTQFRLGNVAQRLPSDNFSGICSLALKHYLEAYAMRPQRAEPLIKIARYYLNKNQMHLAYLFAARAVQIPYPEKDILFVEKWMYDFERYDILGISAWYVGEYEIGEWAVEKALEVTPDAPHLQRNMKLYKERRGLSYN